MYEINIYINSPPLLSKLIYLKTKLTKDNTIDIQNIVNVKKLHLNDQNVSFKGGPEELKPYYTPEKETDCTLQFESRFESGNLLCAFKTEETPTITNYQLYLQNDTNTTGYIQWFFFRVTNVKKGKKVNFNIINMLRKTSMYSHGLKIVCYSEKKSETDNIGWHRAGENILYYPNNLYFYTNDRKRNLYSLSFDYEFKYDDDTVYFANCIPFFYSDVMKDLNYFQLNENKFPFFHRKTLCSTLGGNDLDMFSINSQSLINSNAHYYSVNDKRKGIVLIARQHPGETVSSYVMKGAYDFLMGNSEEAIKLRELYMIRIVPMMNPDGVLVGNSRTSFAGCDLNRRWENPNEVIHPEIFNAKEMIMKMATQREIAFICDFHGHIGAFNSFFYANHKENKRACSLFPFICSKMSKIISYNQSNFQMPKYKRGTGRINLFNELGLNNIVTLETSFFGTNRTGEYNRYYFTKEILKSIGRDVCLGMLSYYYKYEKKPIEQLFSQKKLDIDMKEFEDEIIKEEQEEENEETNVAGEVEENSESEPSIDNFDKDKIMNLLPTKSKRKKIKKNALSKRLYKFNSSKKAKNDNSMNETTEIKLYNPLKVNPKPPEPKSLIKSKSTSKIQINCDNKPKEKEVPPGVKKEEEPPEPTRKDAETQTEEIFFKMHWSYFAGDYPILQGKNPNRRLASSRERFGGFSTNRQRSLGPVYNGNVFNNYYNNIKAYSNGKRTLVNGKTKSNNNHYVKNANILFYNSSNNRNVLQSNPFIRKGFGYL